LKNKRIGLFRSAFEPWFCRRYVPCRCPTSNEELPHGGASKDATARSGSHTLDTLGWHEEALGEIQAPPLRKAGTMWNRWLVLLLMSIIASCQGAKGNLPAERMTEVQAVFVDQDIRDVSRIIEDNPRHAEAFVYRGMVYVREGDYDRAIQDFTKAIEIDPNAGSTYGKRGAAHLELGELEEAIRDLTKAIELYPHFAQAYSNRGNAHLRKGNYEQAVLDFTAATEIHPGYAKAYHGRAIAYQKKRLYRLAAQDFGTACDLGDKDACRASGR